MKRKDECLFCRSRTCHNRIVSYLDNGASFDEIACDIHEKDLYAMDWIQHNKFCHIMKVGRVKRGEQFSPFLREATMDE